MFGYHVDAVMVNRIYPQRALKGYFHKWIELQRESLEMIRESFGEVPVYTLELLPRELRGIRLLTQTAAEIYGGRNPMEVLTPSGFLRLLRGEDGRYTMKLKLPFAQKENLELEQRGRELVVAVKNERSRLTLPDAVAGKEIERARFENGELVIEFH